MKITIGGTMGFKIQGRQYESIDASAVFTMEKEFSDDVSVDQKEMEKISEKVNNILSKESTKRMKKAIENYNSEIKRLRKAL